MALVLIRGAGLCNTYPSGQRRRGPSIGPPSLDAGCGAGLRAPVQEVGLDTCLDSFGHRHFGTLDLGDVRPTRRLIALVDRLCRHPGGTRPDKLPEPADWRAFDRLTDRPAVTHDALLHRHAHDTRRQIAALSGGVGLLRHDATELDDTTRTSVPDQLGQSGAGPHRGAIGHNSLAVRADTGAGLGLTAPLWHHRADVPRDETIQQKRQRQSRASRLWVRGVQAGGPTPAGVLCVDVSDSLSDTFASLAYAVTQRRPFVLRARANRGLDQPVAGQPYLFEAVRARPALAERSLKVQPSPGRRGRQTTVRIAAAPVRLAVPGKHLGEYVQKPLDLGAVRVWEPDTPADEEALEWILLTNVAVTTAADAQERGDGYERRPSVEEYHQGMKTGCRIEALPFDTLARLEPAIAVLSVVTTTLWPLRDAARAPAAERRLATEVIDPLSVQVLPTHYGRRLGAAPTVRQFYLHVARLGGHQNRKGEGFPGWLTLWRGWTNLNAMVDGWQAAHRKH